MRSAAVRIVTRIGLEPQFRLAHAMLGHRTHRRNRLDDLALLRLIRSLPRDANCVDVGANRGGALRWCIAAAPAGRHLAFEPLPDLARELRLRFPSVAVHTLALTDRPGTALFYRTDRDTRSSLSAADGGEAISVATERLDDVLPDGYVPALIKIDVEGAEGLVLQGALRTLHRSRPLVAFEHGTAAARFGFTHADVYRLLNECGLGIFDMRGRGPFSVEGFENADAWNFVAAPEEDFPRVRRLQPGLF